MTSPIASAPFESALLGAARPLDGTGQGAEIDLIDSDDERRGTEDWLHVPCYARSTVRKASGRASRLSPPAGGAGSG